MKERNQQKVACTDFKCTIYSKPTCVCTVHVPVRF